MYYFSRYFHMCYPFPEMRQAIIKGASAEVKKKGTDFKMDKNDKREYNF